MLGIIALLVLAGILLALKRKLEKDVKANYSKVKPIIEKFMADVTRVEHYAAEENIPHYVAHITLQRLEQKAYIRKNGHRSFTKLKDLPEIL